MSGVSGGHQVLSVCSSPSPGVGWSGIECLWWPVSGCGRGSGDVYMADGQADILHQVLDTAV